MTIVANDDEPDNGDQHHHSTYLPPKELHVIAGRSGAGKTHLMFQFLDRYRQHLEPILYVAGDRSKEHHDRLFEKLKIKPWPLVSLADYDADELTVSQIVGQVEDYKRPFRWLDA